MEFVSRLRWLIVIFVSLVFLILIGWGLSTIARNIFNGGSGGSSVAESMSDIEVVQTDVARLTVSGPIVATELQRSYTIEVNAETVTVTLYSDYGQKQLDQKSYINNQEAYDTFLRALEAANVTARIKGTTSDDDAKFEGQCSAGRRYVFSLDDDIRRWATSCNDVKGTAGGRVATMRRLFNKQAPDARDILDGTGLYIN
jgi:hypothetical protein